MTPHIPIPAHTSQRAHAASGHIARIKSAATGASTVASMRSALVHIDLAIDDLRTLKGEFRIAIKNGEKK